MWRVGLLALAACGRIGFDPTGGVADECAAERLDLGPWGDPALFAAADTTVSSEDDPALTVDETEVYFTSNRADVLGQSDIYRIRRASPADAWGPVEHVVELSSTGNENTPELSSDALTIYFSTDRPGTLGAEDIFVATRTDRAATWGVPVPVPELNSIATDRGPSLFDHDLGMAMHSTRAGGLGGTDIYVARRASTTSPWSSPEPIESVNTTRGELRPWMSPCGLELDFQRDPGAGTMMDFFVTRRDTIDEPFGEAVRIDELSSTAYDQDLRLSRDRRHAVFGSARRANGGGGDLFESTR